MFLNVVLAVIRTFNILSPFYYVNARKVFIVACFYPLIWIMITIGDVLSPDWCDDPATKVIKIYPALNFFKLLGADDALATNLSMVFTIWLAIVIPMTLLIICAGLQSWTLLKAKKVTTSNTDSVRELNVAVTIFLLTAGCIVCYAPFTCSSIQNQFEEDRPPPINNNTMLPINNTRLPINNTTLPINNNTMLPTNNNNMLPINNTMLPTNNNMLPTNNNNMLSTNSSDSQYCNATYKGNSQSLDTLENTRLFSLYIAFTTTIFANSLISPLIMILRSKNLREFVLFPIGRKQNIPANVPGTVTHLPAMSSG